MISTKLNNRITRILESWTDGMFTETIYWHRVEQTSIDIFNETAPGLAAPVGIPCYISYNSFRTWPITKKATAGELDNQNLVVFISVPKLDELGYTNDHNYFVFDEANDRFTLRGIRYKCEGHTQVSQLQDKVLFMMITLLRDDQSTIEPNILP